MQAVRPLVLVALLAGGAVGTAIPHEAYAQNPAEFAGPGLIDLLPVGEVLGDGTTVVTVQVVALQPNGEPWRDLKLKPAASAGQVANFREQAPGLYQFDFTPPAVDADQQVTLSLRGKTPSRASVNAVLPLPVRAPFASKVLTSSNPTELVLGQVGEATLSLSLIGPSGQPLEGADLVVTTNAGKVTNITHMGGGRFTARYLVPRVNYPHLAIVSAVDKRDPGRAVGYTVLPLMGMVDYPVQASPNSTVVLRIGDREFGPVQASPEGKAKVPVVVPPGVNAATLVSVLNGQTTEEPIDLRVPETRRIHMVPVSPSIPSDSRLNIPIRVVVLNPDGSPDLGAVLNLTATAGRFAPVEHEGNGIYRAYFLPPDGKDALTSTITASIQGSSVQTVSEEIKLVATLPDAVVLRTDPAKIPEQGDAFKLFAKVTGADGKGVSGRKLLLDAVSAKATGEFVDMKGGDYQVGLSATGPAGAELRAMVEVEPTGLPLRHLFVVPAREHTTNDGVSSVALTVVSTDLYGHPVPEVPVTIELISGDGALPTEAKTDKRGIATVHYTAGKASQLVRVRVTAGNTDAGTAFVQAPGGLGVVDLQVGGTKRLQALTERWTASVPTLDVEKEGAVAPVVAAAPPEAVTPTSDGPIAAFAVTLTPSPAPPGGEVQVSVAATDAAGVAVAGKSLDVLTSKGELGAVSDAGNGTYTTTLAVPEGFEGEIKLSVFAPSGTSQLTKLTVSKSAGGVGLAGAAAAAGASAWGPTPDPAAGTGEGSGTEGTEGDAQADGAQPGDEAAQPGGETVAPETPKEPRPKVAAGDHPWLRARAGFVASSYRYQQLPSATPGPLISDSLNIGSKYPNGENAKPMGFELDGRAWVPAIKYLGFNGKFRATGYSMTAAVFDGTAQDWLYQLEADAIGRYPFDVGADQFWVGGTAGFAFNDFILFRNCEEPDCTSVFYEPKSLGGIQLGAELGAEIDDFYLIGGVAKTMANGSVPYATTAEVNAGWGFTDYVFVDLGFSSVYRQLILEGEDSGEERGELNDTQNMFKVSAGFWL